MRHARIGQFVTVSVFLMSALSGGAHGCGFCASDIEAAVYSYESLARATKSGAQYVVAVIVGAKDSKTFSKGVATLSKISGVDRNTIRSAYDQRAVSFVLMSKADAGSLRDEFSRSTGLRLKILEGLGQRKRDRS